MGATGWRSPPRYLVVVPYFPPKRVNPALTYFPLRHVAFTKSRSKLGARQVHVANSRCHQHLDSDATAFIPLAPPSNPALNPHDLHSSGKCRMILRACHCVEPPSPIGALQCATSQTGSMCHIGAVLRPLYHIVFALAAYRVRLCCFHWLVLSHVLHELELGRDGGRRGVDRCVYNIIHTDHDAL